MSDLELNRDGMKIAGYCVYVQGDFDRSLIGDRKLREVQYPGKTCIYARDEEDAKELAGKIKYARYGPYYTISFGGDPDEDGTCLY